MTLAVYNQVLRAVASFALTNPWAGDFATRKAKFVALHNELCALLNLNTRLVFKGIKRGRGARSSGKWTGDVITLKGRLSVVTYLRLIAEAYGMGDNKGWAFEVYRICFPSKWIVAKVVNGRMTKEV